MQQALEGFSTADTQLQHADPSLWPVAKGWRALVEHFLSGPQGRDLIGFLNQRLQAGAVIFPPQPLRALELLEPQAVRVVVLGQDPYHGRGQAEGLAFSVAPGVPIPPSLRNILQELSRDFDASLTNATNGSLVSWAQSGVLLLNTCLTVEEGRPASHAQQGWEQLTDAVLSHVNAVVPHAVFMLWGAHAQHKQVLIDTSRHLVLTANHPSPLSARRGATPFMGCGHFSRAQTWLQGRGVTGFNPGTFLE